MRKLRTLDVWDTLLRRKCHPDNSKKASARFLLLRLFDHLKPEFQDQNRIFRERCAIEGEEARRDGDGEYILSDVMTVLITRILNNASDINIPEVSDEITEYEIQFEINNTYPDPYIVDFIKKYPAEKTIFLSDFYMPATDLNRLLNHHGLTSVVNEGISSCDTGLNKRSGRLFSYVHSQYNITPEEHVHIGDNIHSDVMMPRALGLEGVHFMPSDEHEKRQKFEEIFHGKCNVIRHISEKIQESADPFLVDISMQKQSAYRLGLNSAPLLIGFVTYIAEQSLKDNIEKLYFFTREGEFYINIWKHLFPDNTLFGQRLPQTDVLEVSRLSTFCASLREVSTAEMMRVWNLYSTQSIFSLFKTLGIDPEISRNLCRKYNIIPENDIIYPWQDKRVQELFGDSEFVKIIQSSIDEKKYNLLSYLSQKGLTQETSRIGIVDIGWRGTIQDNISFLFPNTKIFGYYLGLQMFLNPQPENCQKSSFGPDANKSQSNIHLLDAVSLIEMLCNSPSGSVLGYHLDHRGRMISERLVDQDENQVFYDFVSYFQEAILFAARSWSDNIETHVISSDDLHDYACVIWKNFVQDTDEDLLNAYHSLSHNEIFGMGQFISKSDVPSFREMISTLFSKTERYKFIQFIIQNQLISSFKKRRDIGWTYKIFLIGIIKMALQYKHFRNFLRIINAKK